jgi:hypothetical protein
MRQEFLDRLRSAHRSERLLAWSELHLEPEASRHVLSVSDRLQLAEFLVVEDDDGVHRMGSDTLLGYSSCVQVEPSGDGVEPWSAATSPHTLEEWLWNDFHKPSAIFRSSERGYHRRDSDAVEILARRLGIKEFPLVNFHPLPLHKDGWRQLTTERAYKTIGLVGRLGLFGDRAETDLQWTDARFRFLRQTPPPSYEAGEELRQYYCLQEFEGGRVVHQYDTQDREGYRVDYGIIQKYPVFLGTHWITVVLCCGSSSLGTVAAAQWAAIDLAIPQDPITQAPITLPKTITSNSRLEALLRTRGASQTDIWRPSTIELLGLYVDHDQWSPSDLQWRDVQQHTFEIRLQAGKPAALIIDGEKARLNRDSQNFCLAAKVLLGASQNPGHAVDIRQLARDRDIWDGRRLHTSKVKQRLHNLNKQALKGTLTVDQQVTVAAEIIVTEE